MLAALNCPLTKGLLRCPGVWRAALTALAGLELDQQLDHLVAAIPSQPDAKDDVAVRDAVMLAIRMGSNTTLTALRPAFALTALPEDVDAAFMAAVAYRSVVNLQLLGRDFTPSRDSLRRCRMLVKSCSPGRDSESLSRILSRLSRSR
jgi:hypothetical protein